MTVQADPWLVRDAYEHLYDEDKMSDGLNYQWEPPKPLAPIMDALNVNWSHDGTLNLKLPDDSPLKVYVVSAGNDHVHPLGHRPVDDDFVEKHWLRLHVMSGVAEHEGSTTFAGAVFQWIHWGWLCDSNGTVHDDLWFSQSEYRAFKTRKALVAAINRWQSLDTSDTAIESAVSAGLVLPDNLNVEVLS